MHKYVVYQDSKQEWRWTFYASNGEALAVSSEGYVAESDCRRAIQIIQNFGGQAHAIVEAREQPVGPVIEPVVEPEVPVAPKRKRATKHK
jgi:hypothetical protein